MKDFLKSLKIVFGEKRYLFLAIIVALFFYLINVIITNFGNLINFYNSFGFAESMGFFVSVTLGFWNSIEIHSAISVVIVSIFLGMLVSLIYYKMTLKIEGSKKLGALGTTGVFLGALAPGCAACGIGLVSVLGLGGFVATVLPYNGLELSILAIGLLGFAMYRTGTDLINCEECKVKLEKN